MSANYHKNIDFNSKRDNGFIVKILFVIYGINKPIVRKLILKSLWHFLGKHHQFYSVTLRKIFKYYHDVEIGLYTHGFCFDMGALPPGIRIGRYCSFAYGITFVQSDHPINTISTHEFFYNSKLGYSKNNLIPARTNLVIENDVWIGQNAIILPSCTIIGNGSVLAAGVVVNKDIPTYSIAVGHPCRVIRKRFSEEKIAEIIKSEWWNKSIDEILPDIKNFQIPIEGDQVR